MSAVLTAPLTLTCDDCDGDGSVTARSSAATTLTAGSFAANTGTSQGHVITLALATAGSATPVASETIRWPTGEVEHYCARCAEQARADALMPGDVCGDGAMKWRLPMTMNEDAIAAHIGDDRDFDGLV